MTGEWKSTALAALGCLVLFIGAIAYIFTRDNCPVFASQWLSISCRNIFGKNLLQFANYIPDFSHPFSFLLISACILKIKTRRAALYLSIFWLFIENTFEALQHDLLSNVARKINYSGTYDLYDILVYSISIASGYALIAYSINNKPSRS